MALRQQARRVALVARISQAQAQARQQALQQGERRSPQWQQGQQRHSSSSSKDDESHWGIKMFKG